MYAPELCSSENWTLRHGGSGIRTHAPEETGALNQRLGPLGHATLHQIPLTSRVHMFYITGFNELNTRSV